MITAQYVKPFVKTNKNDFIDAEATAYETSIFLWRFNRIRCELIQIVPRRQAVFRKPVLER